MTVTASVLSRRERFACVGSTNDVVRDWLAAGEPEVCLAVADEQTAGRGRSSRTWTSPPGAALLLSLGFRPTWLAPEQAWRLAACATVAMAEAVEDQLDAPEGTIHLKWPNDLVAIVERPATDGGERVRKLGGVLGESAGLGTWDPTVIVGIGLNAAWHPDRFPAELRGSMTSLHEISGGLPIDRDGLLEAFVASLTARIEDLRHGRFALEAWASRQVTTGRTVALETEDGVSLVPAVGVDGETGALLVDRFGAEQAVLVGDITHVRLAAV